MLHIFALSLALLLPVTLTATALPVLPAGGSFTVATTSYEATLSWPDAGPLESEQAILEIRTGGRTGTMTVSAELATDAITQFRSVFQPSFVSATIEQGSVPTVSLLYDFLGAGGLRETATTIVFRFHEDSIRYDSELQAPNAVAGPVMLLMTDILWTAPWIVHGAILHTGEVLPGDDGTALDVYQDWEVTDHFGMFVADNARSFTQARITAGADLNYIGVGEWRLDLNSAETSAVFNGFIDYPTAGIDSPVWTKEALVFAASPEIAAARIEAIAAEVAPPVLPRASVDEQVVIGLADDGINPYHIAFRDTSPLAYQHPSTYIPGYPAGAQAIELTLDANTLSAALVADQAAWAAVRPDTLYWFPGTKIVGAISDGDLPQDPSKLIFSTAHGTMTGSRSAGNEYSLCPECRIVMHQGFSTESIEWLASHTWIDVQSHSWSGAVPFNTPVEFAGIREAMEDAADEMPVFTSGGNGAAGKLGVVGHPSFTRPMGGAKGAIPVGGHDNGFMTPWTAQYPYVSADACASWAPIGDTLDGYDPEEGSGTSASTPYAAGEAGRIILEARRVLGGPGDREAGILATGAPQPQLGASPLADGDLTVEELKSVLFRTATARPSATRDDGVVCGAIWAPYLTLPVAWTSYPAGISAYPHIGWGGIDITSTARAIGVLHGAPMPVRPVDEEAHAQAESIRATWHGIDEAVATVEIPDVPLPTVWEQDDAGSGGDAGDVPSGAVPVAPGVVYEGRLSYVDADFDDMFAISLQAGDVVRINVAGIGACPYFYSPNGWEFSPMPSCAYPGLMSSATYTAVSAGTYHLAVSASVDQRYAFGFGVNGPAPEVALPDQTAGAPSG